jgi:eukaryotic-like serine/threonine-protein kinase
LPHFRGPPQARREAAARFQREARAAAAISHTNVCPIYDVGEWDGRPYVVMAFVAGRSAADLTAAGPVVAPAAVEIVRQVAEGLAAVHAHGIVHRDIKPANILLDAGGQALIADFGLARFDTGGECITADSSMLGTPAYMAPEQAALSAGEVSPAADVYSLGAVLYELLTGRPPYRGDPVTVIYQVAQQAPPPPSQHSPGLDSALEAIVLKAMARDPAARYPGALAFAGALQRWLAGEATSACPQPVAAPVRRRPMRRLLAMVAAAGLLAAVLFGGVMITLRTRDGSIVITVPESDVKLFIDDQERASLEGQKVGRLDLKPGKHRLTVKRDGAPVYELAFEVKAGQTMDIAAKFPPRSSADDLLRGLARKNIPEAERFDWQPDELVAVFGTHAWRHWGDFHNTDGPLLGFTDDGKNVIAVHCPGRGAGSILTGDVLRVTDAATGKDLATYTLPNASRATYLPEARLVGLLAGEHGNWRWKLWSLATKSEKVVLAGELGVPDVIVAAPGGKLLATASRSNYTVLWDAATGKEVHRFDLPKEGFAAGAAAAFSSDGKLLAVTWSRVDDTGNNTLLRVYDVTARKEVRAVTLAGKYVVAMAFAPDTKALFLSGSYLQQTENGPQQWWRLFSWDLAAGKWRGHEIPGSGSLAVSAAGDRMAFAHALHDPTTGEKAIALHGVPVPHSCVFSPDGKRVAGANALGLIAVHDAATGKTLTPAPDLVRFLAVSADGTTMAVPQFHGTNTFPNVLRLRDVLTGKDRATLRLPEAQGFVSAAFLPDGKRLVTADAVAPGGSMHVWDAETGDQLRMLQHPQVDTVALSADGKWLVSGGKYAGEVKIWDTLSWKERTVIKLKTKAGVHSLAISLDGKLVAGLTEVGVIVYEADGGKEAFAVPGAIPPGPCTFSADGTRLAFAGKVYDTATGKAVATMAEATRAWDLVFAHGGKSLFSSGPDGRLVRRSAADGAVLREWRLPGMIDRIALSADGRYLFTSNHNGTVYVLRLDAPAGKKNP